MWFQNKWDEGARFSEMFKPIPLPAIALVLTAVHMIDIHGDSMGLILNVTKDRGKH